MLELSNARLDCFNVGMASPQLHFINDSEISFHQEQILGNILNILSRLWNRPVTGELYCKQNKWSQLKIYKFIKI